MNNIKEFDGLSIRAMTALGVFSLVHYSRKHAINDSNLIQFGNKMLDLLTTNNIPEWDNECNQIEITGLGDELPEELITKYPEYQNTISQITQNIREISASQIYGEWNPKLSHSVLHEVQKLCQIQINKEFDLKLFKMHNAGSNGWGATISNELIKKWKKAGNKVY
ncbi:hypothetical protein [Aquimarina spongiae]|uniref:Uncharacterized protein n=1 Tax=Aquimarina spongiae TaxID=570521 RepID=A0A1M6I0K1_9FLAO|nr:hypothetical protein [Aquimarina spongiae]SHJ27935.1 hypothetical protein SAMN04488508_10733 [Aquimarina spongiae]